MTESSSSSQNSPHHHHWLPQFLVKPWCDPEGRVVRFYKPHDKIVTGRKSRKGLGVTEDLYRLNWVHIQETASVETDVLAKGLETPTALVRDKLLQGKVDSLTPLERETFATFVAVQALRAPRLIRPHQDHSEKTWKDFLLNGMKKKVDGEFVLMTPEEAQAKYAKDFAGYGRDMILLAMFDIARSPDFLGALLGLTWRVFDVSSGGLELPLADEPVMLVKDSARVIFAALPISPNHIFVAAREKYFEDLIFEEQYRQVLALRICSEQCRRANDFILATNERLAPLVEKYLGKDAEPRSPGLAMTTRLL